MSLQVWLPLLGNINNQGLADLTHTSGTPVYKTTGKIGQCLDLKTQIQFNCSSLNGVKTFSIAFWAKVNNDTSLSTNWVDVIGFTDKRDDGTTGQLRWETCYASGSETRGISSHDNATYAIFNAPGLLSSRNAWHHIVLTVGDSVKEYRDGTLSGTYTANGGSLTGAFWLGQTNLINGEINDVRIYDHALSAKEVKELAKGLVLHYKLDKINGGNANLHKNSDTLTSTWTLNQATVSEGVATITPTQSADRRIYQMPANGSWSWSTEKTYTASIEAKSSNGATLVLAPYGAGSMTKSYTVTSEWKRYNFTFTPTSNGTGSMTYSVSQTSGVTLQLRLPKLEEGNKATPWIPNSADAVYTALGLDDNIEYDCSGYGHNGAITGTLTSSSDSPRYNSNIHISATNQKIHISGLTTSGFSNSYSFAWWAKCTTWSNMMHWGFLDGVRLNGIYNGNLWNTGDGSNNPLYNIGTTTQVTVPSVNEWHHFVMTGNGSKCYVYKDGVLWAEAKTYKTISGTSIYINGWDGSTSYSNTNLDISDFRIYATALSANDVKELYQTAASIDNHGNTYAYELKEV